MAGQDVFLFTAHPVEVVRTTLFSFDREIGNKVP